MITWIYSVGKIKGDIFQIIVQYVFYITVFFYLSVISTSERSATTCTQAAGAAPDTAVTAAEVWSSNTAASADNKFIYCISLHL